jgi:hypothetical protein
VMQAKHEIFLEIFINLKKCIIHGFSWKLLRILNIFLKHIFENL